MRRIALLLLFAAVPATATPLEDRLREQLRAVTTQLRDLQAGQAGAEAAKIAAEKERDALKAKLGGAGGSPTAARDLAAARSQNAALGARLGSAEAGLAEARARGDALAARLATADAELAQLRFASAVTAATIKANADAIAACTDRNQRLVATGRELVTLHQKRYGSGDFPPLQLLRTRIENEAQAMGDRITVDAIVVNAAEAPPK